MSETDELQAKANAAIREEAERAIKRIYGMTFEEYCALSPQERVQMAYDKGQGFAAYGVAAVGADGKPVTEQAAKVVYADFSRAALSEGEG